MAEKKKSTAKKVEKKNDSDKKRHILNIVFGCIAIGAAVVTLLLTPFGRRLLPGNDTTEKDTASAVVSDSTTITDTAVQTITTSQWTDFSIPESTDPVVDPYKNYSILINELKFDYTEDKGITTLTAKDNKNVILTVTPFSDKSYTQLCDETKELYDSIAVGDEFTVEALSSAYRTQTGDKDTDIITTVYCVDDGKGGSIEIKYQTPVNAQAFENDFKILLSMFTLHQ